jgi:hypothetical protein
MTNKELEARIKELEEENEKLKTKEPEKVKQPLVLPDPNLTPLIPYEEKEYVKVKLFKDDYRYKNDLYVAINGKNWYIKRGKEVTLPKYVADFIENAMTEEARIWERVEQEEDEFKKLTDKQV